MDLSKTGRTRSLSFSLVVPCHNEVESVAELVAEIREAFGNYPSEWEAIFVDDGSRDGTFDAMAIAFGGDPHFVGVRFVTNLGKSAAYMAGIHQSRYRLVGTMDGDLQDNPADLLKLIDAVREGADLVVGWKQTGKSSGPTWVMSMIFNGVLRIMSGVKIHDMNCPLRVMKRELALRLNLYGSLFRYIPYFFARQNARIAEVAVENRARLHGASKYTFSKYPVAVADFITVAFVTHYEQRPLHFFGRLGMIALLFGVVIDSWISLMWLTGGEPIDKNLPSLLLGVLFIVIGILFMTTGLLGELTIRMANRSMPYYRTYIETVIGGDRRES